MKRRPSEYGLALAGLGLALATLVLDQAGVELPTWLLITLGVTAAAMIVGGLLIPHSSNRVVAEGPPMGDDKSIKFEGDVHVESGGTIAHTINIVAPQPNVHAEPLVSSEKTDDGYVSRVHVRLDAPYAAQRVAIKVEGKTISRGFFGSSTGVTSNTAEQVEPHLGIWEAGAPLANEYIGEIFTEEPEDLRVEAAIQ